VDVAVVAGNGEAAHPQSFSLDMGPFDMSAILRALDQGGVRYLVVGIGDLRRLKLRAGRPKDLEDLEHLPDEDGAGGR
jgi:hypothetical protein